MRILVTANHLQTFAGSETFTYTMCKAAIDHGDNVYLHTPNAGEVSRRIFELGVRPANERWYNIVLASHTTTINHCHRMEWGPVIQTCHGIVPAMEYPSPLAAVHVAITPEIAEKIKQVTGKTNVPIIRNLIDTDRFCITKPIFRKPKTALSLSKSMSFNKELAEELKRHKIKLFYCHETANPIWEVERLINESDFVISLGRGVMEAMSCGRQSLIVDRRPYQDQFSDGMLTPGNVEELSTCNFTGRVNKIKAPLSEVIADGLSQYDADYSDTLREWSVRELDYRTQYLKYLALME